MKSAVLSRGYRIRAVAFLMLLGSLSVGEHGVAQEDWRLSDVERIVAIGDIHGAYAAFERILRKADLIDESGAWSGGQTYLVIVGDVLDRGPDSRHALDLIMRLETEARTAGGGVAFALGNHEIMNLTGDLRYVSAGEYAAFAAEEPAEVREAEFRRFRDTLGGRSDLESARVMFNAEYPPGFFAHREAFSPAGVYGSWLRNRPVLLVVNDYAFVHGGLAGGLIADATGLNATIGRALDDYLDGAAALISAGLLSRTMDFYDVPTFAADLLERAEDGEIELTAELEAAARQLAAIASTWLYAPDGPVWYRGNVSCNRLTEEDRLSAALSELGASHLVVGHTPTPDARILSRWQEAVLRVDTGMLSNYYGGRASALVIERGGLSALYEDESIPSMPVEQPRRVGIRPAGLTAEALETVLSRAEVESDRPFDATARRVVLEDGDIELEALFMPAARGDAQPAVAAYRLDRLLGLDMVPVTVAREIDGVTGALQFLPASTISETERSENGLGGSAWCPLSDQLRDMYLFDALLYNQARTADRLRYSTENFQLLLMANDQTFSTERGRPEYMSSLPVELTPAWREALGALDETSLEESFGDLLDRRRIRALLARRDTLLELAE